MGRNSALAVLLILMSVLGKAQSSVSEILSGTLNDPALQGISRQLNYMRTESFKSPPLREIDLRIRSNDLEPVPEDYRLRVGILNPGEQRANKSYHNVHTELKRREYELLLNGLLKDKYLILISNYYSEKRVRDLQIRYDRIHQFSVVASGSAVNMVDAIKLDEALFDVELTIDELLAEKDQFEINARASGSEITHVDWLSFDMISPEKMEEKLSVALLQAQFAEVMVAEQEYQLDKERVRLEQAESRGNLGYIQAEYDTDRGDMFDEHFGYQLGINLPIFNTDKPKIQREQVKLIGSEFELKKISVESKLFDELRMSQFRSGMRRYQKVVDKMNSYDALQTTNIMDVESFVVLNNYLMDLETLRNEIEEELAVLFIEMMGSKAVFSAPPYVNYLSASDEVFAIE